MFQSLDFDAKKKGRREADTFSEQLHVSVSDASIMELAPVDDVQGQRKMRTRRSLARLAVEAGPNHERACGRRRLILGRQNARGRGRRTVCVRVRVHGWPEGVNLQQPTQKDLACLSCKCSRVNGGMLPDHELEELQSARHDVHILTFALSMMFTRRCSGPPWTSNVQTHW
jgi:hypothetical protein